MSTTSAQHDPELIPKRLVRARPLFDREILKRASKDSLVKLNPAIQVKNPVMFVVEVGAALTTLLLGRNIWTAAPDIKFVLQICIWLWFTVIFANFAEAMAEARGKAQADTLRKTKTDSTARRISRAGKEEVIP
ncbi:MAG: potassium-transporting ATPase subunit B, partial [Terriglobia bacterium]